VKLPIQFYYNNETREIDVDWECNTDEKSRKFLQNVGEEDGHLDS
jgi:hypothetical protein